MLLLQLHDDDEDADDGDDDDDWTTDLPHYALTRLYARDVT